MKSNFVVIIILIIFPFLFGGCKPKGKIDIKWTIESQDSKYRNNISDLNVAADILIKRFKYCGIPKRRINLEISNNRILLTLTKLPNTVRKDFLKTVITNQGKLEFLETYKYSEINSILTEANNYIKKLENEQNTLNKTKSENEIKSLDEHSLLAQLENDSTLLSKEEKTEHSLIKDFPLTSLLSLYKGYDEQVIDGSIIGLVHYKDTSKVSYYLNIPEVYNLFPTDVSFYWAAKPISFNSSYYGLHAIKINKQDIQSVFKSNMITHVKIESELDKSYRIVISLDSEGAKAWAKLTKENIGRNIAILYENLVYFSPKVTEEILNGKIQITGGFSLTEAQDYANLIKSGARGLPFKLRIVKEQIIYR